MADNKPQINPSDPITPSPLKRFLHHHRFLSLFIIIIFSLLLLLTLTILILTFSVFKIRDPDLSMNSIHIDRLLISPLFSLNATLTADISIANPNAVSFRFRKSTTDFYCGGEIVGMGYAPAGKVAARRTVRINVTVEVVADRVAVDLGMGKVRIASFTGVSGRVDFMGVYKRDLDVLMNCSFVMGVLEERGFVDRVCEANVL